MIRLEHVTYKYPQSQRPALHDIDLEIADGSFVVVTGANGAGKSTFCATVAGFIPHHVRGTLSGRVLVDGLDVATTPLARLVRHVGLVFERPRSQISGARSTVADEIAFGLENLGVPREEMHRRVAEMLAFAGLDDKADRSPFALSGGETQRLALGCILAMETPVLILDEPAAQLDFAGRRALYAMVRRLVRDKGRTVVTVDQRLEELAELADRVIVLHQGRIGLDGPPREVLAHRDATELGVCIPACSQAGVYAREVGLWDSERPVPVTLDQAIWGFRRRLALELPVIAAPEQSPGPVAPLACRYDDSPETAAGEPHDRLQAAARGLAIRVRDLYYTYPNTTRGLAGVSLDIPAGQRVAIVGRNGSGKTTLAKHFIGLIRPVAGNVEIGDWNTLHKSVAQLAHRVGFMFQDSDDQIFKPRVADEIAYGLELRGLPPAESSRRVHAALVRVGLERLASAHPHELLAAERRLVALAAVLVMATPVVVLDEPTMGQDGRGLARLGGIVRELIAAGRTIIAITHDLAWCAETMDRVVWVDGGRIRKDASVREFLAQPDVLEEAGLEVPQITRLGQALGLPGVCTLGEFVSAYRAAVDSRA